MFRNSLYEVKQILPGENGARFSVIIELNPAHEIFAGHFPGKPILPGVCMLQIIKELLATHLECDLVLKNAGSIKYLSIIDPLVNNTIRFDIESDDSQTGVISCKAELNSVNVIFCRFKGEFKTIP